MADLQAIERELEVARERDDNDARVRLITRALTLPDTQPHRAECLDELAYAYQQLGRFDDAMAKRWPPAGTASLTTIPARRP